MSVAPPRARLGFPVARRLVKPTQFKRVFESPARASDRLFTMLAKRNDQNHPRLGLAISVKAAGNAADRNRIKRASRETFRIIQHDLGSIDVVVMARPGITTRTSTEIRTSLQNLFRSIDKKCARS